MKYNAQTTLEFTVEAAKENIANFDLTSEGRLSVPDVYDE